MHHHHYPYQCIAFISDYETALMNSMETAYPEADSSGCWFHFAKAVVAKFKAIGLWSVVAGASAQRNESVVRWMRLLCALPLLPVELIEDAAIMLHPNNHVAQLPAPRRAQVNAIHEYIQSYWVLQVTPQRLSVAGKAKRTNGDLEAYHAELLRRVKVAHPGMWIFMGKLMVI